MGKAARIAGEWNRRDFLNCAPGVLAGGLLTQAASAGGGPDTSNLRATAGDHVEPKWDSMLSITVGSQKADLIGSTERVIQAGIDYMAADVVAEDGISVEVVDLRTLRPLDRETVLDSVRKTGKCLVVYEDNKFGGYGAEVAAIVAEEAFDYLDGPVTRIAGPEVPGVPYNHVLEEWFMVSPEKIAEGIRTLAAY